MKNTKNIIITFILTQIIIGLVSCAENPTEQKEEPCPPINVVSIAPYNNPIWHPSGKFIGFNYTPLDSITYSYGEHCFGNQYFNYDSTGFWLVNTDGKNKRRIFPHQLYLATWSPDGKWIAYDSNIESLNGMSFIWMMNSDGNNKIRIAYEPKKGEIREPSWSPNGHKIVHIKYSKDFVSK